MARWDEDEIPTSPGHRGTHSDLHHTVGTLMAQVHNHRKRIEILEAMALSKEKDSNPPSARTIVPFIKKTVTYAILILAGIISAVKELGLLK